MKESRQVGNWWTRECGARDVLTLALPLVISTGFFSLMLFVDRMFLLWHSADEMAAAMPAGMLHWTMICLPMGITTYVNTFVAQYHGAKRPERIGLVTWQGVRIGLYMTPLFLCAIPAAPLVFDLAGHEPVVRGHEVVYFQTLAFGAGAAVMAGALASFFTGRGVVGVVMYVNCSSAILNMVLDYLWIFGRGGFVEMGIEGAAWATVASQWFEFAAYCWLMFQRNTRQTYRLIEGRRFDAWLLQRLFVYGVPNGLQILIESAAFALITMKMGQFGKTAMAATTMAFNVNAVAFIPMIGVGVAVSTLVGQRLTQGRADLAARATWTALVLAIVYTAVFGALYVCAPDVFLMGHAAGVDPEQFSALRDLTVVLLRFVAVYCLFDAMQLVFVGAIKGAGDTWFVLGNTTIVSISMVAVGLLGAHYGAGGLMWWWLVITAWAWVLGVVYLIRFLQGSWRRMRVIEPEFVEPDDGPRAAAAESGVTAE